ncbi:MAG: hypothetical protein RMN51_07310 [Verrucomicrobiota bacterium]|nr:hypothetical protein [Limisphaera sp.]MDW8381898.1 hypothetical protein [Verrucomicrobiota bacterium]
MNGCRASLGIPCLRRISNEFTRRVSVSYVMPVAAGPPETRLIAHGWDLLAAQPSDVARHLDQWTRLPIDGVALVVRSQHPDGTELSSLTLLRDPVWRIDWFTNELPALRACASRTLRHNFFIAFWSPKQRLSWTDDSAWTRVASNHAVLARLARQGHAIGVMVDPEITTRADSFNGCGVIRLGLNSRHWRAGADARLCLR